MSDKISKVRKLVREAIKTTKVFLTTEGEEVLYGSQAHVKTYDRAISDLINIRSQVPSTAPHSSVRISQCLESLRYLRGRAYRSGLKSGLITED